uniref:Uncharacterized protein n=1 Tax=Gloeochaete wittrockiana TaxID=38269 RepID=A0A096Y6T8_9EUKA|nr:hypothetical protein [Gloeochaete wittrockiana]AIM52050.1 hypothetical protein [Gloeochaete wittrockiana]
MNKYILDTLRGDSGQIINAEYLKPAFRSGILTKEQTVDEVLPELLYLLLMLDEKFVQFFSFELFLDKNCLNMNAEIANDFGKHMYKGTELFENIKKIPGITISCISTEQLTDSDKYYVRILIGIIIYGYKIIKYQESHVTIGNILSSGRNMDSVKRLNYRSDIYRFIKLMLDKHNFGDFVITDYTQPVWDLVDFGQFGDFLTTLEYRSFFPVKD